MIIEGHAGGDHINDCKTPVGESGLDQGHQLLFITRKTPGNKSSASGQQSEGRIYGRLMVAVTLLGFGA